MELHHKYVMMQTVQQLARCGFSISLDEVQAVMMAFVGWNLKELESSQFTHFVADNVIHDV